MSCQVAHRDFESARPRTVIDARHIAFYAHAGQDDGTGRLYIAHLERVVDNLHRLHRAGLITVPSQEDLMIAWLHDTPEDTHVTLAELKEKNFPPYVTNGVDILHRRGEQSYHQYISAILESGHYGAIAVKLADNMENSHPQRREILRRTKPEKADKLDRKYADSLPRICRSLNIDEAAVWELIRGAPRVQPIGPAIIPQKIHAPLP